MLSHCWLKEGGRGEGELHAEPLLAEGEGGEKEESVSA